MSSSQTLRDACPFKKAKVRDEGKSMSVVSSLERTRQSGLSAVRGDGRGRRCVCIGNRANTAAWCSGEMVYWLCVLLCCCRVCLGQASVTVLLLDLDELLLWLLRDLHAVAGPARAQPGSFPIRPEGSLTTSTTPKTRALSSLSSCAATPSRARRQNRSSWTFGSESGNFGKFAARVRHGATNRR
jgi:hypothetical protein